MKKIFFLAIMCLLLISCKEKKIKLIHSKVRSNLFLIKFSSQKDSLLKSEIKNFLLKNFKDVNQNDYDIYIYKYTTNTKYFIDNKEDPGGFSSEEISMYEDDYIAGFYTSKCKRDSTKKVGVFSFYKTYSKPDTIINRCQ